MNESLERPIVTVREIARPGTAMLVLRGVFYLCFDVQGLPLFVMGREERIQGSGNEILIPWHNVAELEFLNVPTELSSIGPRPAAISHTFRHGGSDTPDTCAECLHPRDEHQHVMPEDRPI